MTTTLADARGDDGGDGGTDVVVMLEGLPPGVPVGDNETGTRMALDKLAALD
jgi:hypothetical protein